MVGGGSVKFLVTGIGTVAFPSMNWSYVAEYSRFPPTSGPNHPALLTCRSTRCQPGASPVLSLYTVTDVIRPRFLLGMVIQSLPSGPGESVRLASSMRRES